MADKKSLVITSIADDKHPILNKIAADSARHNYNFILIGDTKSPKEFKIDNCDFWSVQRQIQLPFELAKLTPVKHYSRKNLGYLIAIKNGSENILETDDDNIPFDSFWNERKREVNSKIFKDAGWINVPKYFTDKKIWPRGFPLEKLNEPQPGLNSAKKGFADCPVQQGLADDNPDVDAVYRLTYPLPVNFETGKDMVLGENSWAPFNSQNTYWFRDAFPLLYLPSYCSFRMTDIWRSFVAQRIAWECDWGIYYHSPTVRQKRNDHNLMKDFEDETAGYLNNLKICKELSDLKLKNGKENIYENLVKCYNKLIEIDVIGKEELNLLGTWINDLKSLGIN
ncbi:MAG TPA: STELLO glycosyltransferase family protein [Ignavibacteriaceae bacterium]|nr:STELLO glycosyltransferase family protein [Ignavibacteriaceae bacterium]